MTTSAPARRRDNRTEFDAALLRRRLLAWFRRHRRDLPWRRTRDPYAVWLSELMLQQTQVATVIPYYERFLQRFPSVQTLARAPLEDVLRHWAGLGYYARARNLHAAAKKVVVEHASQFPDTLEGLRALPGVGRYTAGAVASIAFGRRAAVVDGNVARVLARVFAIREPIKSPRMQQHVWQLAESLLPQRNCGDFNQCLMELGATICTPRSPACVQCPVQQCCQARALEMVDRIPFAGPARAPKPIEFVVAAVQQGDRWLFEPRPAGGLWGGLWQFPTCERADGLTTRRIAESLALDRAGAHVRVGRNPIGEVRWQLTHRTARFVVHHGVVAPRGAHQSRTSKSAAASRADPRPGRWLALAHAGAVPLSAAMRKVIQLVQRATRPARSPALVAATRRLRAKRAERTHARGVRC